MKKAIIICAFIGALLITGLFSYDKGKRDADKWYIDKTYYELVDCSDIKRVPVHLIPSCNGFFINNETDGFVWAQSVDKKPNTPKSRVDENRAYMNDLFDPYTGLEVEAPISDKIQNELNYFHMKDAEYSWRLHRLEEIQWPPYGIKPKSGKKHE